MSELIDTGYQVDRRQFTVNLAQPYAAEVFIGPLPEDDYPPFSTNVLDFSAGSVVIAGEISEADLIPFFTLDVVNGETDNLVSPRDDKGRPHPDRPPDTLWQVENQPVLVGQRFPFFIERRAYGGYGFDYRTQC